MLEALGEDVGAAYQVAQRFGLRRIVEVDVGLALAVAGVHLEQGQRAELRRGDVQHVGAVLGERARARRAGEHAREVEHAHAGQRPVAIRERLGRGVADLLDLEHGLRCEQRPLWMCEPFVRCATCRRAQPLRRERVLELEGAAMPRGGGDFLGRCVRAQTEFGEDARRVVEAPVQVDVAPVAAFEDRRDGWHAPLRRRAVVAVDAQEREAVQRCGRMLDIDGDLLR